MESPTILDLTMHALVLILLLSLPVVATAVLVGIVVGLLQSVTQIQDQGVSFGMKAIAVILTIIVFAKWGGGELYKFAHQIITTFPAMF